MNKSELIVELQKKYKAFIQEIESMNEKEFMQAPASKWTAGQHLEHLCRSVRPLSLGLKLPKFMPKLLFGKANRPSKTYEALVNKYKLKIEEGAKASGPYIPPQKVPISRRSALCRRLQKLVDGLGSVLDNYSEHDLDHLILPHPLLGKVTIREMIYFTIYHAKHHRKLVLNNLN
jgi:hypothetical protein